MNSRRNRNPRRKIPVLRINLNTGADYKQICEVPEFKDVIMQELVIAVKDGLQKKKDYIELFEISDSKVCVNLEKKEWKSPLNEVLNYFSEKEDYDKCVEIRDLLNQL